VAIDATDAGGDVNVVNSGRITGDVNLSAGDDVFDGSQGRVKGAVNAGAGNDVVIGGRGRDELNGGSGDDVLTGGRGSDVFVASEGSDAVSDFEVRKDRINVSAFDFTSKDDLDIQQHGDDTVIDFGDGNALTLSDTQSSSLRASSFQFA
jgi:Ca2+-binding RTX toxin-like protein